jgi:hypothetical protein
MIYVYCNEYFLILLLTENFNIDLLGAGRPRGWSSSPGRVKNLLFPQVVQTGSGEPGALSPGVKPPWLEDDHSPPTSVDVKKMWIYISTPPYAFVA